MKLQGKIAIVTGAGGGIGREIARELAREGAAVVVSDIAGDRAEQTVEQLRGMGAQAVAAVADVRDSAAVGRMVELALAQFGPPDILVNCAGGSARLIGKLSLFVDSDEDTWDWVLGVNLKGVLVCSRAVLPHMIAQGGGKIINIASIAGVVGLQQRVDYSAAKGGVIALTKTLAMEVAAHGVNVNCVSPGMIGSAAVASDGTYLGRTGTTAEIAYMVRFLASDEADFITGQNYIVDGGRVLGPRNG